MKTKKAEIVAEIVRKIQDIINQNERPISFSGRKEVRVQCLEELKGAVESLNTNDEDSISKAIKKTKDCKETIATCAGNFKKLIRKTNKIINLVAPSSEQLTQIENLLLELKNTVTASANLAPNVEVKEGPDGLRNSKQDLKEVSEKLASAREKRDFDTIRELRYSERQLKITSRERHSERQLKNTLREMITSSTGNSFSKLSDRADSLEERAKAFSRS